MNKTDINKKKFLETFEKTLCNVSEACKIAGISRMAYYDWMRDDPVFAQASNDLRARTVDLVETVAKKEALNGNSTLIIFFLKTQAKDRGYGDQIQVEHSGGVTVEQRPTRAIVEIIGND